MIFKTIKTNMIKHHFKYNNQTNFFGRFGKYLFIGLTFLTFYLFFFKNETSNSNLINSSKIFFFDKYEVNKFNKIGKKLIETKCSDMWSNQKEFINGIIRRFKPHKVLEVGVNRGGSSIIILNAIEDIKGSKLYSIDLNEKEFIGNCVNKYFPNLIKNWILFKGNIATEYMEKIGKNIDIALFDTSHLEPGEILDFLIVLPFLKEEAIVIFHDIAMQMTNSKNRNEFAPYIIFNGIRGQKFLPSGKNILKQDIGAIKLEKNQQKYYEDYFRLLGGQWQYFPKEIHNIYDTYIFILF